jgi:hypothetical protein
VWSPSGLLVPAGERLQLTNVCNFRKDENVGVEEYTESWERLEYIHFSYDPFDRAVWNWPAFSGIKSSSCYHLPLLVIIA